MMDNNNFLLPMQMLLSTAGLADELSQAVINSYCISLPGWLPVLSPEGSHSVMYHADRVARQFGYDQATPSMVPLFHDFIESQGRFLLANFGGLVAGHEETLLPAYDRAGAFTTVGTDDTEEKGDSEKETFNVGLRRLAGRGAPYARPISPPAPKAVEVIEVEDSLNTGHEHGTTDIVQPPSGPRAHLSLAERSSAVVGGMFEFTPVFDLYGGPSTVFSSSPSRAGSPYIHSTSSDGAYRSPSQPAPSEERKETPSTDTHESGGALMWT
ncbi:hypothetical protein RHGRI_004324 [Rhododendron griersonianum]|uniref:Uncharacterized protein n=1 Tax=Rhododendron griersonianum TaxID=479676 RepID=A0AAV6L873_9ERIC|nr:hypothetical protein RHGRI_004324 [Rhododendron griersonianum]